MYVTKRKQARDRKATTQEEPPFFSNLISLKNSLSLSLVIPLNIMCKKQEWFYFDYFFGVLQKRLFWSLKGQKGAVDREMSAKERGGEKETTCLLLSLTLFSTSATLYSDLSFGCKRTRRALALLLPCCLQQESKKNASPMGLFFNSLGIF